MSAYKLKPVPPSRRVNGESLFPDYPSNARTFISLDSKLLPYWHLLFDLCPSLLKLDPPDGLEFFRCFMTWAYRHQPAQDWTFHISACRWLLSSEYAPRVTDEHVESMLSAAAARWINSDTSSAQGILLTSRFLGVSLLEGKAGCVTNTMGMDNPLVVSPTRFDFAWSPLSRPSPLYFKRWLRIPE